MSLFSRNGTTPAAVSQQPQQPEIMTPQPLPNTGFMMMFRAFAMTLGLDPASLANKLNEFELLIKGTLGKVLSHAESMDVLLRELRQEVAEISQRQKAAEVRLDENMVMISASLADIAERASARDHGAAAQQQPAARTKQFRTKAN